MIWTKAKDIARGKPLCDMHDGIHRMEFDVPHEVVAHVRLHAHYLVSTLDNINAAIVALTGKQPLNKMMVCVDECNAEGNVVGMYCYDAQFGGIVEIKLKEAT
jgi:hypothetical protein